MNKSIVRCPSCWEGVARDTERCPRCHTRLTEKEASGRRVFGFAFWRNCILLVISVALLVTAFVPMFRETLGNGDLETLLGDEIRIESDREVQWNFSAFDMLIHGIESTKHLTNEEMSNNKYSVRASNFMSDFQNSIDETRDVVKNPDGSVVVVLKDNHIRILNDFVDATMHVMFLSGEDIDNASTFTFAVLASALYVLALIAFFVLALVNFILNLCGRAAPYTYVVRLVALMAPALAAYCGSMYTTGCYNTPLVGTWMALGLSLVALIAVCILGLIARREHSWFGILTRGGTLILATAMIAAVFMPMLSISVQAQFSNATDIVEGRANLGSGFYGEIDLSYGEYDALREDYIGYYEDLEEMKKSEFEEGDVSGVHVIMFATLLSLCADRAEYTHYFSYTYILLIVMCIFTALVMWQSLCYFALGKDMKYISWFFRGVALLAMLLVLVMNIVIVCVSNAGADGSLFMDGIQSLGHIMRFHIGVASIFGTVCAIAMMCIPHGRYKKWVWGAYVLVNPEWKTEEASEAEPVATETTTEAPVAVSAAGGEK